ncbi:MAG: hypothetical protein J6Y36_03165 [Treponema sp.]|nr:hypothetical protein [Treponema sp.]
MKNKLLYVFIVFILTSCSTKSLKSLNLTNECKINYTIEGNKVINIELVQENNRIILFFPEEQEIQFSIDNSMKKCTAIISREFYSLEAINGLEQSFAINMNKKNTSLDLKNNDNLRTVIQYNIECNEVDHYEQIDGKEYSFKINKEGFSN